MSNAAAYGNEIVKPGDKGFVKEGWSASGKLVTSDRTNTVSLQVNFPFPKDYTVQFNVQKPNAAVGSNVLGPVDTNVYAAPEALITWTVNGNTSTRRVSVGNGTSLSGTAQAVKVIIYDNSTDGNIAFLLQPPTEYTVSVLVTPGTRASTDQPPTLMASDPRPGVTHGFYIMGVVVGSPLFLPIPQDAGILSVFISAAFLAAGGNARTPLPGEGTVLQAFSAGAGIIDYRVDDASDVDRWTPITTGANFIIFQNFGAAGSDMQYTVTFGIDG